MNFLVLIRRFNFTVFNTCLSLSLYILDIYFPFIFFSSSLHEQTSKVLCYHAENPPRAVCHSHDGMKNSKLLLNFLFPLHFFRECKRIFFDKKEGSATYFFISQILSLLNKSKKFIKIFTSHPSMSILTFYGFLKQLSSCQWVYECMKLFIALETNLCFTSNFLSHQGITLLVFLCSLSSFLHSEEDHTKVNFSAWLDEKKSLILKKIYDTDGEI